MVDDVRRQTVLPDRVEARQAMVGAAAAVTLVGALAAFVGASPHDNDLGKALLLWSAIGLTAGLYDVHVSLKRFGPPSAGDATREDSGQRRGGERTRDAWLDASAANPKDHEASPMEARLTGSLKSIKARAEQGLVASDAEKARHLAAIWSMAACDLDDDRGEVSH